MMLSLVLSLTSFWYRLLSKKKPVSDSDFRLPYIDLLTRRCASGRKMNGRKKARDGRRNQVATAAKEGGRRSTEDAILNQISLGGFLADEIFLITPISSVWGLSLFLSDILGLKVTQVLYFWTPIYHNSLSLYCFFRSVHFGWFLGLHLIPVH